MNQPNRAWPTLALLSLFMLINFWDRAALGFAAAPIMRDLKLSHSQFGLLGGIFFALFSVAALGVGRLLDSFSPRWIIASTAMLWALAQALMAGAFRLPQALASRLLLGAGEGPAFPSALRLAYANVPRSRHAMVTALISVGPPLGIASGAVAITWAIEALGWREAFILLSLVSAVWSIVWIGVQRSPAPAADDGQSVRSWWQSLRFNSTTIGVILAAFGVYWVLALAVNWFPALLQAWNFSSLRAGQVLGVAWAIQALVFPLIARALESLRRRGYSSELALAVPAACGVAVSGLALIGFNLIAAYAAAPLLIVVCLSGTAVAITCLPPLVAEITPLRDQGTALGVFAAFSSTAGVFAPFIFGRAVDSSGGTGHGYRVALLASGSLLLVAAAVSLALMKPTRHGVR